MGIRQFVATKAFIVHQGKILLLRESSDYKDGTNAGKFDAVGGRVEAGQRFDESLVREIKEETGLSVRIGKPFYVGEWRPVVRGEQWQVVGIYFECFSDTDTVVLSEDHKESLWIMPGDHPKYPLTDNAKAAFEAYEAYLRQQDF